jgi:hypothetical protein
MTNNSKKPARRQNTNDEDSSITAVSFDVDIAGNSLEASVMLSKKREKSNAKVVYRISSLLIQMGDETKEMGI